MAGSNEKQALNALLRKNLPAFIEKVFNTVSPKDIYLPNWHIAAIAYEMLRCLIGEAHRLVITQPPRSLKSICTSVALVAWALGHNPELRFICVSYSQDLASELSRQFRMVVESDWYRALFPKVRWKKITSSEFVTSMGGSRLAVSIGGSITGRGGDIIIIDDPLKAEDASSEAARKAVIDWFKTTLTTRLNDKSRGSILVVLQRLHEEDLAGHLLENGQWQHLNLPAIAIEDQRIRIGPGPDDFYLRKEGSVLHPEREPLDALKRIKSDLGSLVFSAQYQQQPIPYEGNLVKREWIKFYSTEPDITPDSRIIQSWDIATTTTERSDWSVCTTWLVLKKNYYLLDVWRGRLEFPDLKRKVISLKRKMDARTVLIEKAGLGLNLVQDLVANSPDDFPNPIGITPKGDKLHRMEATSYLFENGQVHLPEEAPWLDTFLDELLAFPSAKHDDQVDSVSQFLERIRRDYQRQNDRVPGGISTLQYPKRTV